MNTIETNPRVISYKVFRGSGEMPWDKWFEAAAKFASSIGHERVVSISHSSDSGSGTVGVLAGFPNRAKPKGLQIAASGWHCSCGVAGL